MSFLSSDSGSPENMSLGYVPSSSNSESIPSFSLHNIGREEGKKNSGLLQASGISKHLQI